jgi:hypothetical protein
MVLASYNIIPFTLSGLRTNVEQMGFVRVNNRTYIDSLGKAD